MHKEREARKATKKAHKPTKNINEFLREKETKEVVSGLTKQNSLPEPDDKSGEVHVITKDSSPVDPATGELALVEASTESSSAPPAAAEDISVEKVVSSPHALSGSSHTLSESSAPPEDISVEKVVSSPRAPSESSTPPATAEDISVASPSVGNYASSGPQNDIEICPKSEEGEEKSACPKSKEEEQDKLCEDAALTGVTKEIKELHINGSNSVDVNISPHDSNDKDQSIDASPVEPVEQEVQVSSEASQEQVDPDSLLSSLQSFCALEELLGENRFACVVCTKDLIMKRKVPDVCEEDLSLPSDNVMKGVASPEEVGVALDSEEDGASSSEGGGEDSGEEGGVVFRDADTSQQSAEGVYIR